MEKKVVLGILDKMEVEYSKSIRIKRAEAKLVRALDKGILPKGELSEEEISAIKKLGFDVEPREDEEEEVEESVKKKKKKSKVQKENEEIQEAMKGKKAEKGKDKKTEKEEEEPKEKAGKERKPGAFAAFKEMWSKKKKHVRQELIDSIVEKYGIKDYSVANYISAAKKDKDVLGSKLTEKDGVLHLDK